MKKNDTVTAEVIAVNDGGIEVQLGEMTTFIRRAENGMLPKPTPPT
jgi:DNA-directed RNA polymerase subunit E'/Rpb7